MLQHVTDDFDDKDGVYVRFHTDGSLFNPRRLEAHTKTKEKLIRGLLFADDAALVAHIYIYNIYIHICISAKFIYIYIYTYLT